MKKTYLYTFAILAVIILVGLINSINDKRPDSFVYAYADSSIYVASAPGWWYLLPEVVNDFDTSHFPASPSMPSPPLGMETDYMGWQGSAALSSYPTPVPFICGGSCGPDALVPRPVYGTGFLRMEWTGSDYTNPQYIHLTNYANAVPGDYGTNFENVGCSQHVTFLALSGPLATLTSTAGDWGCFSYLRLYTYLNRGANNGDPDTVTQTVSLFDGSVTITSGSITIEPLGMTGGPFRDHLTISLNYFANHYDTTTGRYFSVSNITDVIINAPVTNYSLSSLPTPTVPSAFTALQNAHSLYVYYDHLILGDYLAVPYYASPASITVTTAFGDSSNPIKGAEIGWAPFTSITAGVPVTGYHIYKSLSSIPNAGPYISVAVAPANVTSYVDVANNGGAVSCYKILTCNNGPSSDPTKETGNTINATYNEPLLKDTIVIEKCGYVAARMTPTSTPTIYVYWGTPTVTQTVGGALPTPTGTLAVANARVFPNPFNPNKGKGKFKVGNVQLDTKIHIYSMDGSLVKDGVYTDASKGYFEWDGRNKNGSKVVSGLYYLVLEDPKKKTAVFRIIVCYKCDPVYDPATQ